MRPQLDTAKSKGFAMRGRHLLASLSRSSNAGIHCVVLNSETGSFCRTLELLSRESYLVRRTQMLRLDCVRSWRPCCSRCVVIRSSQVNGARCASTRPFGSLSSRAVACHLQAWSTFIGLTDPWFFVCKVRINFIQDKIRYVKKNV